MTQDPPSDIVAFFSIYGVVLWLTIGGLLAVLTFYFKPILALIGEAPNERTHEHTRRVCARAAFFLSVFNLSPELASVLGLPLSTVFLFVLAFAAIGFILRRSTAMWPLAVFLALIVIHLALDLSFFIAAIDYAEALGGFWDILLFRGEDAVVNNAVHVFFLLPADIALLFQLATVFMDGGGLIAAIVALRLGNGR